MPPLPVRQRRQNADASTMPAPSSSPFARAVHPNRPRLTRRRLDATGRAIASTALNALLPARPPTPQPAPSSHPCGHSVILAGRQRRRWRVEEARGE